MFFQRKKLEIPAKADALPGRESPLPTATHHFVNGAALHPPFPAGHEVIYVGMGCFWGAERMFWQRDGVTATAVGYAGGHTPNATYEEVCTGKTGHNEVVMVVYDPAVISTTSLLATFWEGHNPTQFMRQGNDVGTQYRSGIYWTTEGQRNAAIATRDAYASALAARGLDKIVTEIVEAPEFYYAEAYHQQYLAKNPGGYCGLGGTGVTCPVPAEA